MEFRILGPLRVEDRGRELPLGGPGERHLLAVLLCLANEPVPMQRLIDELWEDRPPDSARNIVQQYVSRLRRTLDDETRLTTEPGGYVLRLEDGELDQHQFQALVNRASGARHRGHAAALLREALSLWQGPALAGTGDGPTVSADRMQLEEARLLAIEDRVDCDLELGRHCEVTAELESLVAQFPERERFLGQLMVALYRSERQREALRCYADYRKRLAEESGLEPGGSLIDLESRILADDPSLAAPRIADRKRQTNLPQRLSSFIGREKEIADLTGRISEHRLVTLTGVGGIGKTSLGLRAVADLHDAFPDGVWMIDLAPLGDSALVAGAAAGALGVALDPKTTPIEAVVDHARDHVALIVLDNCEHLVDGAAEFAFRVLEQAPDVSILATSREPLGVTGEALVRVPPLSLPADGDIAASEAVQLFVERARLLDPGFSLDKTNSAQVAAICRQLDGIPLAIELAAARLSTMALDRIADGVDDRYELLTRGARTAPERHKTLRAMMDWSHDVLTKEEQIVFRRLGAFAGTFTAAGAEHVCGYAPMAPNDVAMCLDQLVDASLVDPPEPSSDRFRMLETIREYANRQLDESGETTTTMRRLAEFLSEAGPATHDGLPGDDYASWYGWRDAEQDNFRHALSWAYDSDDVDTAVALTIEFRNYVAVRHLVDESRYWVDLALDRLEGEMSRRHTRIMSFGVANEFFLGDPAVAMEMATDLYSQAEALGDLSAMAFACEAESMWAFRTGDMVTALAKNTECVQLFREVDDPRYPSALGRQSFYLARLGRYEEAHRAIEQMTNAAGRLDQSDPRYEAASQGLFGALAALYEGDTERARRLLDQHDEYVHSLGPDDLYVFLFARLFLNLAEGRRRQALDVASELGMVIPDGAVDSTLRDVAYAQAMAALENKGAEAALPHLRDAVAIAIDYEAVIENADLVLVVADTCLAAGDLESAVRLGAAACTILRDSGIRLAGWQRERLESSISTLRAAMGGAFDVLWADGSKLSPHEMVAYAADYLGLELPSPSPA